jgi:hypothetical protein
MIIMQDAKDPFGKWSYIDSIAFSVDAFDLTGKLPYPRDDGKAVNILNKNSAKMLCEGFTAKNNRGACKNYANRLSTEIDGNLACRWGKPYSREQREASLRVTEKAEELGTKVAGEAGMTGKAIADIGTTGAEFGKAIEAASFVNSCWVHEMFEDETVEKMFSQEAYPPEWNGKKAPTPAAVPAPPAQTVATPTTVQQAPPATTGNPRVKKMLSIISRGRL